MEEKVLHETELLVELIDEQIKIRDGREFNPRLQLEHTSHNVISMIVFGEKFSQDPDFKKMISPSEHTFLAKLPIIGYEEFLCDNLDLKILHYQKIIYYQNQIFSIYNFRRSHLFLLKFYYFTKSGF